VYFVQVVYDSPTVTKVVTAVSLCVFRAPLQRSIVNDAVKSIGPAANATVNNDHLLYLAEKEIQWAAHLRQRIYIVPTTFKD
jgi:hypothetical protein